MSPEPKLENSPPRSRCVPDESHYDVEYLSPARMASIGYQLHLLQDHLPDGKVLEVGVGSGLFASLASRVGRTVQTLDIEPKLQPDIVGSVTDIPLPDQSTDVFACFQVLEHLPWERVGEALSELSRVSRIGGLVSIPTDEAAIGFSLYANGRARKRLMRLPQMLRKRKIIVCREHEWELGANRTRSQFERLFQENGLRISHRLRPLENLYHQFFVVRIQD